MINYYSSCTNQCNSSGNMANVNFANTQNTYILDKKIGDVNGDQIPDVVFLTGEKKQNPFYENIKVLVQDGRTLLWYAIPLFPDYSMAYTPWLLLANFTSSGVEEIMVNLPVGGSGALTYYYVISFINNNADYILKPQDFAPLTDSLGFEVIYMDYYKVLIKSSKLEQTYILDVSERKDFYQGTVYDNEGRLIKPLNGFVINLPHLYPKKIDGGVPFKLEAYEDIAGTSHADRLGYIVTSWKYSRQNRSWTIDPQYFYVLLG